MTLIYLKPAYRIVDPHRRICDHLYHDFFIKSYLKRFLGIIVSRGRYNASILCYLYPYPRLSCKFWIHYDLVPLDVCGYLYAQGKFTNLIFAPNLTKIKSESSHISMGDARSSLCLILYVNLTKNQKF